MRIDGRRRRALKHIGADQDMLKHGLKKRRCRARINDAPRLLQRLRHMFVIVRDQMSIGIVSAGKLAYFMAGIEDELRDVIDRGGKMAGVEVVPKAQMALLAG